MVVAARALAYSCCVGKSVLSYRLERSSEPNGSRAKNDYLCKRRGIVEARASSGL